MKNHFLALDAPAQKKFVWTTDGESEHLELVALTLHTGVLVYTKVLKAFIGPTPKHLFNYSRIFARTSVDQGGRLMDLPDMLDIISHPDEKPEMQQPENGRHQSHTHNRQQVYAYTIWSV